MINALRNSHVGYRRRGGPSGPVQLTIAYTATQFDFKWKAPATSTLVFHWGDGTTSEVSGNDSTLVTTTSSYSTAGTYNFWITGDVLDLTYIDVNGQAFVTGSLETWTTITGLTVIDVSSTGISGSIEGFSGHTSMTIFNVDNSSVTGDAVTLVGLTSLTSFLFNVTAVTWGASTTMSLTSATVNAASSGMSDSTQVNNFIDSFEDSTGCTFDVSGTNAHRTAASNDDLNTLLANGNTITLNDVLGAELHTSLNAANDSATQAITAFSDYSATIDGATKVDSAIDFLSMIPQGSEEVTNGAFAADTDWTKGTGWSIAAGVATKTAGTASNLSQNSTLGTGKYFVITFTLSNYSAGNVRPYVDDSVWGTNRSANGTYTEVLRTTESANGYFYLYGDASFAGDIDNVSVKELQVLGSDLVTNGSFATDSDWAKGDGWTISAGTANCDGSQTADSWLYQSEAKDAGDVYLTKFTISNYSAGNVTIKDKNSGVGQKSSNFNADGTYSVLGISDGYDFTTIVADLNFIGSIDNVSVHKLTFTKEIAGSDNYDGTHYVLPIDSQDFAIPFTYAAEAISAQKFGGESNATTGWTSAGLDGTGANVFESAVVAGDTGEWSLHADANDTPASGAYFQNTFTVDNSSVYRLSWDWRHIGSGTEWDFRVDGVLQQDYKIYNSDTSFEEVVFYVTSSSTSLIFRFNEDGSGNDGGVYVDNFSLKKVTFP